MVMLTRIGVSGLTANRLDPTYYRPEHLLDAQLRATWTRAILDELRSPSAPIVYGVLKPDDQGEKFRVAKAERFEGMFVSAEDCDPVSKDMFHEFGRAEAIDGDLLIAIGGYVGRPALLRVRDGLRVVVNRHLARVRIDKARADSGWVLAYFSSALGERQLTREITGSVQAGINLCDLRLVDVPLPSVEAQRYIGDKVRQAERLRERARRATTSLSRLEEGIPVCRSSVSAARTWKAARRLFDPVRLDPKYYAPEFLSVAVSIGSSPSFARLGALVENIRYGASVDADYVSSGNGLPFVRGTDLSPNRVQMSAAVDLHPRLRDQVGKNTLHEGQVLITRSGTVGVAAAVTNEMAGAGYGSFMMSISLKDGVSPYFIAWFLNSWIGQNQIRRRENGAIQQNVNIEELSSVAIWKAPERFQQQIESEVRAWHSMLQYSECLTSAAKQLVEHLIGGRLTESDLVAAQKLLEAGNRSADRQILMGLRQNDAPDAKPLIPDVGALYALLDESEWQDG